MLTTELYEEPREQPLAGAQLRLGVGVIGMGGALGVTAAAAAYGSQALLIVSAGLALLALIPILGGYERLQGPITLGRGWRRLAVVLGLVATTSSAHAQAQETSPPQDYIEGAEIRNTMEEAAESEREAAEEFARYAMERAEEYQNEASATATSLDRVEGSLEEAASMFDVETFDAEAFMSGGNEQGPRIYVLVSLGMPDEALRRLAFEAHQHGTGLFIRGFYGESIVSTQARIAEVFDENEAAGVSIDPRPFRAFGVEEVPAIVYAEGPIEPCGGFDCVPIPPDFDIIRGNITIDAALRIMGRSDR